MSGHISGVQTRLKEKQHGLIYTHCVVHRIELAVLDSLKFDSYLKEFDEGINKIFQFYYYSPTRRKELRDLAKLFQDEFKQLGRLKNIRWIASRERALKLLEINYKVLVFDLESKSYGTDETSKKALGYLNFLKNPRFLFYLHFFEDLVEVLRPLSLAFQSDRLLACQVPRKIDECCAIIDALAINPGDAAVRLKEQINVDTHGNIIYKEVELDKPAGRRKPDVDHTPVAYEELYHPVFSKIIQGAQDYLQNRFRDFKQEPLSSMVKIFDIEQWPVLFTGSDDFRKWGFEEVNRIAEYYHLHLFISAEEKKLASKHWPLFREKVLKLRHSSLLDIFSDITCRNSEDIRGMIVLLQIMMTISPSTAACERGFSCMNREKTTLRTGLTEGTLDDIMRINIDGSELDNFESNVHVSAWLASAKTVRHLGGHKTPAKKKKVEE